MPTISGLASLLKTSNMGMGPAGRAQKVLLYIVDSEKCDGINVNSDIIFGHLDSSESALLLD